MKILSVIDSLGHGGAETVLMDLVAGLREHEHRVVHFSRANRLTAHPQFIAALARRGVDVHDAHWTVLGTARGRREVLGGFAPDVVLFHWWGNDPWRGWVAELQDVPRARRPSLVFVMHHAEYVAPSGYDRYVLVSESQRPQVAHVEPHRVLLIPNGIDARRFGRRAPRRPPGTPMTVGRISSLRGGKIGVDWIDAVDAFAVPDTRFVVAGEGPLRAALARRAVELGCDDRISFPGYVARADVPDTLGTFDVFCYTTSTALECHPLALLEALAAGVPVVAEARGGVPGVVRHGVNGLLADSVEQVGEHLHRLRRDDVLRERLARGARASAPRFSHARQLAAYRALLTQLDAERGAPPRSRSPHP